MASTYTTRIGLEKQGDGENANTWGLKLNSNVIDLVDEAVAGYETIDLSSGAVSLTDTDGVPNQARNFGLKFTGALSADTTVTVPAKEKIYYIFNDTTEDYTVFIKPAGGTAVTVVDSGLGMIAGVDGSNINLLQGSDPDSFATKVQVNALSAGLADGSFVVATATNAASATNAGTLNGLDSTYFTDAANLASGILPAARLSGDYAVNNTGTLDGFNGSDFLRVTAESLGTNGYVTLSNGLIIQWGRKSLSSSGGQTLTWNTPFTTACFMALGVNSTPANATQNITDGTLGTTSWTGIDPGASGTYHWIAIGR